MNVNLVYKIWTLFIICIFIACILLYIQKTPTLDFSRIRGRTGTLQKWNKIPNDKPILVWIIHGYPPGLNAGSEFMAHTMNKHLVQNGINVCVACPRYPQVVFDGVFLMDLNNHNTIHEILTKTSVLMSHHDKVALTCMLGKKYNIPVIELIHNTIRPLTYGEYKPYRIYNSKWLQQFYKANDSETIVVRPPVDYREYETPDGMRRYVTLINVNEEKGGEILVKLAYAMPHVEFLGIKGAYGKQVIASPCPSNLRYENTTLNIKHVYARTKILIMPSHIETWGRTAVEAMSSGIPVIANTTDGLVESLGEAGIFAQRNKLDEWVTSIDRLLTNPNMYEQASKASKKRAIELDPADDLKLFEKYIKLILFGS